VPAKMTRSRRGRAAEVCLLACMCVCVCLPLSILRWLRPSSHTQGSRARSLVQRVRTCAANHAAVCSHARYSSNAWLPTFSSRRGTSEHYYLDNYR
jgi:hypothetical protein